MLWPPKASPHQGQLLFHYGCLPSLFFILPLEIVDFISLIPLIISSISLLGIFFLSWTRALLCSYQIFILLKIGVGPSLCNCY